MLSWLISSRRPMYDGNSALDPLCVGSCITSSNTCIYWTSLRRTDCLPRWILFTPQRMCSGKMVKTGLVLCAATPVHFRLTPLVNVRRANGILSLSYSSGLTVLSALHCRVNDYDEDKNTVPRDGGLATPGILIFHEVILTDRKPYGPLRQREPSNEIAVLWALYQLRV